MLASMNRHGFNRSMRHSLAWLLIFSCGGIAAAELDSAARFVFPKPTQGKDAWQVRQPSEAGLRPSVITQLEGGADRWALWRDGYLVHVSGDFDYKLDVKSLRKTWHALTVGAALGQGKLQSLDEPIGRWGLDLQGQDARATWRHVITQSSARPKNARPRRAQPRVAGQPPSQQATFGAGDALVRQCESHSTVRRKGLLGRRLA
jgi:hypothetical protein